MRLVDNFDKQLAAAVRDLPGSYRPGMAVLTFIGEPPVVIISGLMGYLVALLTGRADVEHAFIYGVIAFGLNTLLKLVLRRKRPHGLVVETLGVRSYSFPSGHAFGTVIFYGLFSYLSIRYLAHPWDVIICALLAIIIFLIGVSRIYLDAHYPSDVVAGWLLGGLSLVVIKALAF